MHDLRHGQRDGGSLPACVAGLRRVDQVRVIVGGARPIAEVTGVAHRCPQTFRVSMAAAVQLADAGVPLQIGYVSDGARNGGR